VEYLVRDVSAASNLGVGDAVGGYREADVLNIVGMRAVVGEELVDLYVSPGGGVDVVEQNPDEWKEVGKVAVEEGRY